jgi:hypothetical protein
MKIKKITWKELDKIKTADEIARLLMKHGIKGIPHDEWFSPLSHATGWDIYNEHAELGKKKRMLTPAQREFVKRYDRGDYPDLIAEDEEEKFEAALEWLLNEADYSFARKAAADGTELAGFRELCLATGQQVFVSLPEEDWQDLFAAALEADTVRFNFRANAQTFDEGLTFDGLSYEEQLEEAKKHADFLARHWRKPVHVYDASDGREEWVYTAEPPRSEQEEEKKTWDPPQSRYKKVRTS